MSVASGDQASATEARHSCPAACCYKCISCGQRFWQKQALVHCAARCRGMRYNPDGSRWVCKAWRCRYNDQCPGANAACSICGAFKPPEFMPTKPVSAFSPAFLSRSASLPIPALFLPISLQPMTAPGLLLDPFTGTQIVVLSG